MGRNIPLRPETRSLRTMSLIVTALMVALGIVALAGAAALRHADLDWRKELAGRWTVELGDGEQHISQAETAKVVAALGSTPGVRKAQALEPQEVAKLLKPWLGDATTDLPLPVLIDVMVDAADPPAADDVKQRLAAVTPAAKLDDHANWTGDMVRLLKTGEAIGLALFGIVAVTTALTVAATARARLAANREEIELLHILGAGDRTIARQFQTGALISGIIGAAIGAAIAAAALAGLFAADHSFAPLLPRLWLSPFDWGAMAAAPVGSIVLGVVVARRTALALVRRLP
jgi:cell division transport system permease protein